MLAVSDISVILPVLLLLFVALIIGEILTRFDAPAVTGEILAGILLGPAILDLVKPNDLLSGIADISVFFIVLVLGVQEETNTLRSGIRTSVTLTFLSFVIPVAGMFAIAHYIIGLNETASLFLSIAVGVPSISITSILVRQKNIYETVTGKIIVASVVITDMLSLIMASVIVRVSDFVFRILGVIVIVLVIIILDIFIRRNPDKVSRFIARIHAESTGERIIFGSIIVASLLVSYLLDLLGVSFLLGAFFAGILVSDVSFGRELKGMITRTLSRMVDSFFSPIFFSIAGLSIVIPDLYGLKVLFSLLPVTAILSAFFVYVYIRRKIGRNSSMYTMGITGSRGAVSVIVATIGLDHNFLTPELYSVAILATLVLSIVLPLAFLRHVGPPEK